MKKALIAMSGGVDSSLAAKLTMDAGYTCIGCTMRLYENEDIGLTDSRTCCSLDDVADARSVAFSLGMPYYVFNFTDDFRKTVIADFVACYEAGTTPNPCIECNIHLKFGKLLERAKILGCDHIVTGHYARIEYDGEKYLLKKAADASKDQTYVLYGLTQEQLSHLLLPLGGLQKEEVRKLASEAGFINAGKADSQDICFVPDGDYGAFLQRYTGKQYPPGDFIDENGKILGRHRGIVQYTVGQRRGLGLPMGRPVYVKQIDPVSNTVTVAEDSALYSKALTADRFNWISGDVPSGPVTCCAKIRYRHKEQSATVLSLPDGTVRVVFDEPQRAITPGQSVVLYDGDTVLGGGRILRAD